MDVDMDFTNLIRENIDVLMRSIDPSPQFVNKLYFSSIISREDSEKIKSQATTDSKIDTILSRLFEICSTDRKDASINAFLNTLRSCGQQHVANIFEKTSSTVPMSEEHFAALTSSLSEIKERLDPECGIIDRLFSRGVISLSERERIMYTTTCSSMISAIIETLLRKSDCAFGKFVEILCETGQDHVAYLLNQKCSAPALNDPVTCWEKVPMSDEHCQILRSKIGKISDILDPECGIVDELYSRSVFSLTDLERINACSTYSAKANEIIATLLRKPDCAFQQFVDELNSHGQQHVVFTVTGNGLVPVREEFVQNMAKQRAAIIESMNPKHSGLLDILVGSDVLSIGDYDRVDVPCHNRQQTSDSDMNVEILRLISRRSQDAFGRFILALCATGQNHVAQLFIGEEVEGKLIITFSVKVDDSTVKLAEQQLKIKLSELLADGIQMKNELMRVLAANDISVSYVKDGCIAIGFRCRTAEALKCLKDLHERRELDRLFTATYQSLFAEVGNVAIIVNISDDSFRQCDEKFKHKALMSAIHRESLLKAAKSQHVLKKFFVTENLLNELSLCERRKQAIRGASGTRQAQLLLEMIARQPDSEFEKFTKVLEKNCQLDLVRILTESASDIILTDDKSEINDLRDERSLNTAPEFESKGDELAATSHQSRQLMPDAVEQAPLPIWKQSILLNDEYFQPPTKRAKQMEGNEITLREQLQLAKKRETQLRLYIEEERKRHKDQLEELMERERRAKKNETLLAMEMKKVKQESVNSEDTKQRLRHNVQICLTEITEKCESLKYDMDLNESVPGMNAYLRRLGITDSAYSIGQDYQTSESEAGYIESDEDDRTAVALPSNFLKLPMELLEILLMKVFAQEFTLLCCNFIPSSKNIFDPFGHGLSGSRLLRSIESGLGHCFLRLTCVCNSWRRTVLGWPQSTTKKWFKHKIRSIIDGSIMLKVGVLRKNLVNVNLMEPEYGLLEELLALGLLNRQLYAGIQNVAGVSAKNGRIIEIICENISESRCRDFLKALRKADQQHVANYIRLGNVFPETFGDVRPLDEKRQLLLDINSRHLVENIDLNDAFLLRLQSSGCINQQQREALQSIRGAKYTRNRKLLDILTRRSIADFNAFIDCLLWDNQVTVARLLLPDAGKSSKS